MFESANPMGEEAARRSVPQHSDSGDPGVPEAFACADSSLLAALAETEIDRGVLYLEQARLLVNIAGIERFTQNVKVEGDRSVHLDDAIREQIAVHMRWSFSATQNRIDHARLLAGPLQATAAELASGRITVDHAVAIARVAERLSLAWSRSAEDQEQFGKWCRELQESVLPVACAQSVAITIKIAERMVERIDAIGQKTRRKSQAKLDDVSVLDEGEGRALLMARMGMIEAQACLASLRARAQAPEFTQLRDMDDQPFRAGQLRIRALIATLIGNGQRQSEPSNCGSSSSGSVRANVDVVVDLATLLGLQNAMALTSVGAGTPVLVSGIDVREFLEGVDDIRLRRLVCDPLTGHLIDLGRKRYAPSARLREFITVRDVTCRFPSCQRSARNAQIDHANEWNRGGETNKDNLGALCIRHHQLKTHGGWDIIERKSDGSCTWRSPAGYQYPHKPHDYREDLPPPP